MKHRKTETKNRPFMRFSPRFYLDEPRQKEAADILSDQKGSINHFMTEAILYYAKFQKGDFFHEEFIRKLADQISDRMICSGTFTLSDNKPVGSDESRILLDGLEAFQ